MPANRNWRRWIHASAGKTLRAVATAQGVSSITEGIHERDDAFMSKPDRVEVRVNGPFTRQTEVNQWDARVFINVLISSVMGEVRDSYIYDNLLGAYHEALDQAIPCFKKGGGIGDDDTLIGCLEPLGEKSTPIRVLDFGVIDATDQLRRGNVSAVYEIELSN